MKGHLLSTAHDQGPFPHEIDINALAASWNVRPAIGLSADEAARRLIEHGHNQLREPKKANPLVILAYQFASPVVYILGLAAAFSAWMQEWAEFIAILIVLIINSMIGFVTEWRAIKSMDALRKLSARTLRVRRDEQSIQIAAIDVVPGDIMLVEAGDVIAADARVLVASNLCSNESALTGESEPAIKSPDTLCGETVLGDRINMLHKGCAISAGSGEALVTGTGMHTELGRISALVQSSTDTHSPLENQLASLSRDMVGFTLIVTVLVGLSGFLAGQAWQLMVQSAIALAVATIPEGLPIVATLALARGMRRMANHNALIERLSAVETLGSTSVIMTDKTGTLTENVMHVASIVTAKRQHQVTDDHIVIDSQLQVADAESSSIANLLRTAALCNKASLGLTGSEATGDPMEVSLLRVAENAGLDRPSLIKHYPEIEVYAFDTQTRRMATTHQNGQDVVVAVKGAPEAIFEIVSELQSETEHIPFDDPIKRQWQSKCTNLAAEGLRVLALAGKRERSELADPFCDLILYGVVGFRDPPRCDVKESVSQIRQAGVSVVMVTGDHPQTASYIAQKVGITDGATTVMGGLDLGHSSQWTEDDRKKLQSQRVFSRVSPEQKLDLIALHQAAGNVVAMTGDGINDAPALKKADIGIAMGIRGTQVAKEAADMILQDDAISTLVHAIAEGRVIFTNIRRFTLYLLSCNLSEILVVAIALMMGLPLPLLPLQILFLNLVTDVFPAFALGTIKADRDVMIRKPRPSDEQILGKRQYINIAIHGVSITASTLLALGYAMHVLQLPGMAATSVSFYTLALAQLWHVLNMRNWREPFFKSAITRNGYIWAAVLLCVSLLGLATWIPIVSSTLELQPLDTVTWLHILAFSTLPVIAREVAASIRRYRHRSMVS